MPDQLGFAIIGCGMIARFHARALAEIPQARVAALVSRTPANAHQLLDETGTPACPVFGTVEQAVKAPGVDAVVITTPSGAHLEPAAVAAAAGKHVVVEKPLEITGERCDRIIQACDRHRVKLCTIFPSRFGDANAALKAAVEEGKFGRLTLGETTCKWWRTQQYYDEGGWKGTQALDGAGR
jgi:predicted dehydrogenase